MGVNQRPHAGPDTETVTELNTAPGGSPIRGFPLPATEDTDDEGDVVIVQRPPVRGVIGRMARWVRIKWFQYEITFGSYCFEWWEKAMIHLLVLGVVGIFAYGIWRQALVCIHVFNGFVDRYAPSATVSVNGGGGAGAHGVSGGGFSAQGAPTI